MYIFNYRAVVTQVYVKKELQIPLLLPVRESILNSYYVPLNYSKILLWSKGVTWGGILKDGESGCLTDDLLLISWEGKGLLVILMLLEICTQILCVTVRAGWADSFKCCFRALLHKLDVTFNHVLATANKKNQQKFQYMIKECLPRKMYRYTPTNIIILLYVSTGLSLEFSVFSFSFPFFNIFGDFANIEPLTRRHK